MNHEYLDMLGVNNRHFFFLPSIIAIVLRYANQIILSKFLLVVERNTSMVPPIPVASRAEAVGR